MHSENSKIVICIYSFSKQIYNIWVIFDLSVFETTPLLNLPIYSIFPPASIARSYRVTDKDFVAET